MDDKVAWDDLLRFRVDGAAVDDSVVVVVTGHMVPSLMLPFVSSGAWGEEAEIAEIGAVVLS